MKRHFLNATALAVVLMGAAHLASAPPAHATLAPELIKNICCGEVSSTRCCGYFYCTVDYHGCSAL